MGRCPECNEWNSLVEAKSGPSKAGRKMSANTTSVQELSGIQSDAAPRMTTLNREFDRVLGGGIVPGSLILVGGDPGIGKSTLLLQIAQSIAQTFGSVLYVSGEESPQQIKLRANRLGIDGQQLFMLPETDLEQIIQQLDKDTPTLAIVDSIQTMYLDQVSSASGSVAQVRECTLYLMHWAKSHGVPILITGHVTKEGTIAGPRVLEHMVDAVLYLEGDSFGAFRILRGVKNRFGSTNEVGIFEMGDNGMVEVANPSEAFLSHRQEQAIGSAIVPTIEGTRPLLVEIQALATPTAAPTPRRVANGVDYNRLILIAAVLGKHLGLSLGNLDIVVNVVGGLKVSEPAADLAIATAIVSSLRDTPLGPSLVLVGELGLSGEIRPVNQIDRRLTEANALGFQKCITPRVITKESPDLNLKAIPVRTIREAVSQALATRRKPASKFEV